jgi:hypothetical protein
MSYSFGADRASILIPPAISTQSYAEPAVCNPGTWYQGVSCTWVRDKAVNGPPV